jgi:hypothetical protein
MPGVLIVEAIAQAGGPEGQTHHVHRDRTGKIPPARGAGRPAADRG